MEAFLSLLSCIFPFIGEKYVCLCVRLLLFYTIITEPIYLGMEIDYNFDEHHNFRDIRDKIFTPVDSRTKTTHSMINLVELMFILANSFLIVTARTQRQPSGSHDHKRNAGGSSCAASPPAQSPRHLQSHRGESAGLLPRIYSDYLGHAATRHT